MLAPERRTRTDLIVAAALVVTVLVAASVVWLRSDARGTTSSTWDGTTAALPSPGTLPDTLDELWRAPSDRTFRPLVERKTVTTAHGGSVIGRDPLTGEERWRYERDRELCGVAGAWGDAVAVYPDDRGCGQVTALNSVSGARGAQRTSDADDPIRLVETRNHVIAYGRTRLEMWRSDLVRTVEYGRVDAPVNPNAQPRTGCELLSADADGTVLAVLEQCEGEPSNRLTLLDPTPDDAQKPEQYTSSILPDAVRDGGAQIVGVMGDRTAVYLPPDALTGPRIASYDAEGTLVDTFDLGNPAGSHSANESAFGLPAEEHDDVLVWWTGHDTVGLEPDDYSPLWVVEDTLGYGDSMAGSLLLPVDGALLAVDAETGSVDRRIEVERGDVDSVSVAVVGDIVLEQRADEVVALR